MLKRLLLVLIVIGLLFGGIFGWKMWQMQKMGARMGPPPPATVSVTEVIRERWEPRLSAVGSLTAFQGIFVTNEVAGTIREILFQSGQVAREGEGLLKLDDSVDQAELRGLLAERDLAEIKYRRLSKLLTDRSISLADVDEAKANLESAEARVASKRAVIAKKLIRAPFSGLLGIRKVDVGQYLAPGSPLVPLNALQSIYADFSLPERHFAELRLGQPVTLTVAAYPGRHFTGTITAMDPGVAIATRSLQIRATLQNPEQRLRPGMFAEVEVLLPPRDGILTLSQVAITYNPYGDSVFMVAEKEGQAQVERRQIVTGRVQGGRVEILDGLKEGDRVVLTGQVKLRNGQAVRIDNRVVPQEGTTPRGSK
jgi:membrane fusion protein, multidrug efflux system